MFILYYDEAGCPGTLTSCISPISPLFVISGLIVPADFLPYLTRDFMALKKKYFLKQMPENLREHHSNWIQQEVKGSDIRRLLSKPNRNVRRPKTYFLKELCVLLKRYDCKIVSNVYIKGVGLEFRGAPAYTATIQSFYSIFQHFLEEKKSKGLIIGDSRNARQNSQVSHSIFSQKMSYSGDKFSQVVEMPTFVHSENSAGVQIADLLASGLIWPFAIDTFCMKHINSVHIRDYSRIKQDFLKTVMGLQFRYIDKAERKLGGFSVRNKLSDLPNSSFFKSKDFLNSNYKDQKLKIYK